MPEDMFTHGAVHILKNLNIACEKFFSDLLFSEYLGIFFFFFFLLGGGGQGVGVVVIFFTKSICFGTYLNCLGLLRQCK